MPGAASLPTCVTLTRIRNGPYASDVPRGRWVGEKERGYNVRCKERSVESNVVVIITTGLVASKQPWWPELRYLRNQERRG